MTRNLGGLSKLMTYP